VKDHGRSSSEDKNISEYIERFDVGLTGSYAVDLQVDTNVSEENAPYSALKMVFT
jgi:hypothetical protein